jgi:predicted MFS family arabinose efflux permease
MEKDDLTPNGDTEYKVYRSRWVFLFMFSLGIWSSGAADAYFTPIADEASDYYGVNMDLINLFATSYFIAWIPTAIPAVYLLKNKLWLSGLIVHIMCAIGCWIRFAAGDNYGAAIFGQFVLGCTNAIALSAAAPISAAWFPPEERVLSTLIAINADYLGFGIGYLIAPFSASISEGLLITACISTTGLVLFAVTTKRAPPSPPSASANQKDEIWPSFKKMIKNPMLMLIMALTGSGISILSCYIFFLSELLEPLGYPIW